MNKTTKILIALMLTSQVAMAVQVYSSEKLNDGTYIRKCRYSNGKIDYCTQKDALKAIEVFNNPWKYMTPAQKAQWEKNNKASKAEEARSNAEKVKKEAEAKAQQERNQKYLEIKLSCFKYTALIEKQMAQFEDDLSKLSRKREIGLDIDEKELNLLEYKLNQLSELHSVDGERNYRGMYVSLTSLCSKYDEIFKSYRQGLITQEELKQLIYKLHTNDEALKEHFEQILAMTDVPKSAKTNAPTTNKLNNGFNQGLNMLNNAASNAAIIRGIIGK